MTSLFTEHLSKVGDKVSQICGFKACVAVGACLLLVGEDDKGCPFGYALHVDKSGTKQKEKKDIDWEK